ncbi:GLPGLI family protein [Bizionia argentinensis JUB59]|uniref:GLPGLI family protein n=1 Tax=Bizionia argentinensis JUB59 TaxID=1046627 RepID=G2EEX9_9FLAO|nr:GLPGLI family protein [Bizionia argentinensis]EGV42998.1 GLPGLI family protein [Bizionia argentinensis JUB59]
MKNRLLTLLLLLSLSSIFGQNTSGIIKYTVDLNSFYDLLSEKYENDPNNYILKINKELIKVASGFQYILEFNGTTSKFEINKGLAIGEKDRHYNMAIGLTGRGTYFTNLKTNKQLQLKEGYGDKTYIESNLNIDWTLTKETKKIGDFICYKATSYKELPSSKVLVTVWYAPQIPIAFGPKEYVGNLPGLVLEYEDNVVHFTASKIVLNPKKAITINWPEGKTISKEDYQKQNSESFSTLKENSGR